MRYTEVAWLVSRQITMSVTSGAADAHYNPGVLNGAVLVRSLAPTAPISGRTA